MRLFIFGMAIGLLAATPSFAADDELIGTWEGNDSASMAIYRTLTITDTHISWPRTNNLPKCKARYQIISTQTGETFPDRASLPDGKAGRTFRTVKVRMGPEKCAASLGFLQFSFPSDMPGNMEMVEYDKQNASRGWMHFFKPQPE